MQFYDVHAPHQSGPIAIGTGSAVITCLMTKREITRQGALPLSTKQIKGIDVPTLGFGTAELEGDTCRKAVLNSIETGYRHLDTARAYGNEAEVGAAVAASGISREEIFLTSKVKRDELSPHGIETSIDASLKALQTDYLDLVLIHWPNPESDLDACIQTFESFRHAGKIRRYGVSNFTAEQFREAVCYGDIFCNQVEYHPLLKQDTVLETVRQHGAALTAYSPLAQGEAIGYPELEAIADKHGKSSEQVALRWLIEQENVLAIPRSSSSEHIQSNFDIFDFRLDAEDRECIAELPKRKRQINPSFAPEWDKE